MEHNSTESVAVWADTGDGMSSVNESRVISLRRQAVSLCRTQWSYTELLRDSAPQMLGLENRNPLQCCQQSLCASCMTLKMHEH